MTDQRTNEFIDTVTKTIQKREPSSRVDVYWSRVYVEFPMTSFNDLHAMTKDVHEVMLANKFTVRDVTIRAYEGDVVLNFKYE
jgi:hypothetical protein